MDTLNFALLVTSGVVAGLVAALHVIAPLTKSDKDNKLLTFLRFVQEKILVLVLPKTLRK